MRKTTDARRRPFAYSTLHVERDGSGTLLLRDEEGHDPLSHDDPMSQLEWFYLFAQADQLRALVKELATYLEMHRDDGYGYAVKLAAHAWVAIVETRPPQSEIDAAETRQTELNWRAG